MSDPSAKVIGGMGSSPTVATLFGMLAVTGATIYLFFLLFLLYTYWNNRRAQLQEQSRRRQRLRGFSHFSQLYLSTTSQQSLEVDGKLVTLPRLRNCSLSRIQDTMLNQLQQSSDFQSNGSSQNSNTSEHKNQHVHNQQNGESCSNGNSTHQQSSDRQSTPNNPVSSPKVIKNMFRASQHRSMQIRQRTEMRRTSTPNPATGICTLESVSSPSYRQIQVGSPSSSSSSTSLSSFSPRAKVPREPSDHVTIDIPAQPEASQDSLNSVHNQRALSATFPSQLQHVSYNPCNTCPACTFPQPNHQGEPIQHGQRWSSDSSSVTRSNACQSARHFRSHQRNHFDLHTSICHSEPPLLTERLPLPHASNPNMSPFLQAFIGSVQASLHTEQCNQGEEDASEVRDSAWLARQIAEGEWKLHPGWRDQGCVICLEEWGEASGEQQAAKTQRGCHEAAGSCRPAPGTPRPLRQSPLAEVFYRDPDQGTYGSNYGASAGHGTGLGRSQSQLLFGNNSSGRYSALGKKTASVGTFTWAIDGVEVSDDQSLEGSSAQAGCSYTVRQQQTHQQEEPNTSSSLNLVVKNRGEQQGKEWSATASKAGGGQERDGSHDRGDYLWQNQVDTFTLSSTSGGCEKLNNHQLQTESGGQSSAARTGGCDDMACEGGAVDKSLVFNTWGNHVDQCGLKCEQNKMSDEWGGWGNVDMMLEKGLQAHEQAYQHVDGLLHFSAVLLDEKQQEQERKLMQGGRLGETGSSHVQSMTTGYSSIYSTYTQSYSSAVRAIQHDIYGKHSTVQGGGEKHCQCVNLGAGQMLDDDVSERQLQQAGLGRQCGQQQQQFGADADKLETQACQSLIHNLPKINNFWLTSEYSSMGMWENADVATTFHNDSPRVQASGASGLKVASPHASRTRVSSKVGGSYSEGTQGPILFAGISDSFAASERSQSVAGRRVLYATQPYDYCFNNTAAFAAQQDPMLNPYSLMHQGVPSPPQLLPVDSGRSGVIQQSRNGGRTHRPDAQSGRMYVWSQQQSAGGSGSEATENLGAGSARHGKVRDCSVCDSCSEVVVLPCGHVFHYTCMRQWCLSQRMGQPVCPTCKQVIFGNGGE